MLPKHVRYQTALHSVMEFGFAPPSIRVRTEYLSYIYESQGYNYSSRFVFALSSEFLLVSIHLSRVADISALSLGVRVFYPMVPQERLELPTFGLQNRYSTV